MRTSLLLSAIIIASGLSQIASALGFKFTEYEYDAASITFMCMMLILFVVMDVVEFLSRIDKK